MLARFQNGCLTTIKRKDGKERWLFPWRERSPGGGLRERNKNIGTIEEYPEKSKKLQERVAKLRLNNNSDGPNRVDLHDDGKSGGALMCLTDLLPGYAKLGITAPVLLVVLRVVQGIRLGGEFGGASSLLSEFGSERRSRAFWISLANLAGCSCRHRPWLGTV